MATRVSRKLEVVEHRLEPKTLTIGPLNPVIGAEIDGVDLSRPLPARTVRRDPRGAQRPPRADLPRPASHPRGPQALRTHVRPAARPPLSRQERRAGARRDRRRARGSGDPGRQGRPELPVRRRRGVAHRRHAATTSRRWARCSTSPRRPRSAAATPASPPPSAPTRRCRRPCRRSSRTLTATHDGAKPYTGGYGQAPPPGGWPKTVHPVVIRHPGNGKKSLYVNRGFTTRINELDRKESDALLELLWNHIDQRLRLPVPRALDAEHAGVLGQPRAPSTTRSGTTSRTPAMASACRSSETGRRPEASPPRRPPGAVANLIALACN